MENNLNEISEIISEAEESEAKQWLITYADMITLLLTFFVMLLAISSLDTERFEEVMNSIQFTMGASQAMGGKPGRLDPQDVMRQSQATPSGRQHEPLLKDLKENMKDKEIKDSLAIRVQGNKIILRTQKDVLFHPGSAILGPGSHKMLDLIAKIVKDHPGYRLDIQGHTDPKPIKTAKIADNWELSALRATAVLRYLIKKRVSPRRLTATGYADTDPLAPNTSPENMAKNRRVEFVLEKRHRMTNRSDINILPK